MVGRGTDAEAAVFQSRLWGPSPVHWEALLNDTRRMAFGPHLGRASHDRYCFDGGSKSSLPISPIGAGESAVPNPLLIVTLSVAQSERPTDWCLFPCPVLAE